MHEDVQGILYSEEMIAARVKEMGRVITEEYREKAGDDGIVLISVLRGAAIFMADLARAIDVPLEMDFMSVSSYGNAAKSSGRVNIIKDVSTDLEGRHVIIAEDILDSGLTLAALLEMLQERKPASLSVVTLLRKKTKVQADVKCAQIGFECEDEFIVGYGLDFAQRYRNLPYIGVLKPEVYQ